LIGIFVVIGFIGGLSDGDIGEHDNPLLLAAFAIMFGGGSLYWAYKMLTEPQQKRILRCKHCDRIIKRKVGGWEPGA
jgi:hypothetical protein